MVSSEEPSGSPVARKLNFNPQAISFTPRIDSSPIPSEATVVEIPSPPSDDTVVGEQEFEDSPSILSGRQKRLRLKHRKKRDRKFKPLFFSSAYSDSRSATTTPVYQQGFFDKSKHPVSENKTGFFKDTVASNFDTPSSAGVSSGSKEKASPLYGNALTWKSTEIKLKDEYGRVRRGVRTVAPEMLSDRARPSGERVDIFPRSASEYKMFKSESVADRMKDLTVDMENMSGMMESTKQMEKDGIPRDKRVPKSAFGPDGKIYNDGLGPVFAQSTVWSEEYIRGAQKRARWPTRSELIDNGDQRENPTTLTHGGRHLPEPREPQDPEKPFVSYKDRTVIQPSPMDMTGPIYRDGTGAIVEPTPAQVNGNNQVLNEDPTFEARGLVYLGSDLMDQVGRWKKPVVPEWQKREREELEAAEGLTMMQRGMNDLNVGTAGHSMRGRDYPLYTGPPIGSEHKNVRATTAPRSEHSIGFAAPMRLVDPALDRPQHAAFGQMQFPQYATYQHQYNQAPGPPASTSSGNSNFDLAGWTHVGRHVVPGSNMCESFWLAPWGETIVYRDTWR
jgi:hypothetical protein